MFRTIQIRSLGPCADATIEPAPMGRTVIRGPSESGKSTIATALSFLLWGIGTDGRAFDTDAIREGEKSATVTATTARGTELRRGITRSRRTKRTVDGEEVDGGEFATAIKAVARTLPADGSKVHAARLVMVPHAWRALAEGPGGGRALRDALAELAPGDLRDEVARLLAESGHTLADDESVHAKDAEAGRKRARKIRDEAIGRRDEAARVLARVESDTVETPEPDAVEAAQAVADAAEVWTRYAEERARYGEAVEANKGDAARREKWTAAREKLGDAPVVDASKRSAAKQDDIDKRGDLDHARRAVEIADAEVARIEAARDAAVAAVESSVNDTPALDEERALLADLEAAGDTCPMCERDGWESAATKLETQRAVVSVMEREHAKLVEDAPLAKDRARDAHAEPLSEAKRSAKRARKTLTAAMKAAARAAEALSAVEADADRRAEWQAAVDGLGPEPSASTVPEAPAEPEGERTTPEDVEAARATIEAARRAEVLTESRAQDLRRAKADAEKAEQALANAEAAAARADALVDAVRRAPGELLRRGLDTLGDLGPVTIRVPDDAKTAIEVRLDGRAWGLASRGRQVYGDLCIRLALRRALRLPYVPVIVDDVGAWSGEWPAVEGPSIWLVTAPGALTVEVDGAVSEVAA